MFLGCTNRADREHIRRDGWVMPWKETDPMDERKRRMEDWLASEGENIAGLCRLYQISRKTGYKWLERFRQGGFGSLGDRSRAAHHQPRRIAEDLEQRLIEARRRHPSWGPKKLRAWLEQRDPETYWPPHRRLARRSSVPDW